MPGKPISEISIRGVHKLLSAGADDAWIVDFVDRLLGAIIAISPIVVGPAALPLLALIEPNPGFSLGRAAGRRAWMGKCS